MNRFKSSALKILKDSGKPLHYKEITRLALEAGILETNGNTPESSMNAQLITDVNKNGVHSDFIKTAPATLNINPNKPKKKETVSTKKKKEILEKIGSGFIGKGGEHYVTSELLFRGYNASIMSVDIGMDIIATKNNKLFSLQVNIQSSI